MLSATTAESRLSTAARIATVSADGSSGRMRSARNVGIENDGRPLGMPPNFEPMVSTGSGKMAAAAVAGEERDDRTGHARESLRHEQDQRERGGRDRRRRPVDRRKSLQDEGHPLEELARIPVQRESEEVLDLRRRDQQRDAVREAEHHGARDELHRLTESGEGEEQQDDAGHHRHHQQPGQAVLRDDAGDDHDERAGRSADLDARSAERRDEESADDRRVDAGLGRDAAGDAERHGQRQRHQAHGDARDDIRGEAAAVVPARGTPAAPDATCATECGTRWWSLASPARRAGRSRPASRACSVSRASLASIARRGETRLLVHLAEHAGRLVEMRLEVAPEQIEHLDQDGIAQGVVDLIACPAIDDHLFGPQDGEMLGGVGLLQIQLRHQRAGGHLAVAEGIDHGNPGGIGQGLKDLCFEFPEGLVHGDGT